MSDVRCRRGAIAACVATLFLASGPAMAQVKEAIWEKTFCLDERGTAIDFVDRVGEIPPRGDATGLTPVIVGEERFLRRSTPEAAQFLFARACIEAAQLGLGRPERDLECVTAEMLTSRYGIRPNEIFRIVAELGEHDDTRDIARQLNRCR